MYLIKFVYGNIFTNAYYYCIKHHKLKNDIKMNKCYGYFTQKRCLRCFEMLKTKDHELFTLK